MKVRELVHWEDKRTVPGSCGTDSKAEAQGVVPTSLPTHYSRARRITPERCRSSTPQLTYRVDIQRALPENLWDASSSTCIKTGCLDFQQARCPGHSTS